MEKESRSTLLGSVASSGSMGSRLMWDRWQWPPTVVVGEPSRPMARGLRLAVGIVSGGKDGVVDGLPIAQSSAEG